jgi:hypothetical protein
MKNILYNNYIHLVIHILGRNIYYIILRCVAHLLIYVLLLSAQQGTIDVKYYSRSAVIYAPITIITL